MTVRFVPTDPATPNDWRRRVETADKFLPLSDLALNIAYCAASMPENVTRYPMSVPALRAVRRELREIGIDPTYAAMREAIAHLAVRRIAAPWWLLTDSQATYQRKGR